jgi:sigma-B regulation protein RsbU (phosphoserine phosphatase)
MGDVSGKGAAAALYGATTVGMLRSLATQKLRPSEMLRQLNQHLTERRIEARFMTLCFATWQKGRQRLRIANAGHWQPLLWKDGRCEKVPITGLPLGIEDDAGYEERAYHLAAGEILVFYSDGITETANAAGEFFGAARLQDLVARHRLLDANGIAAQIFKEMEAFAPGDSPADDRTLVVLKVR